MIKRLNQFRRDMKRLIINADDFGLCAAVNRGIARAFENGIVTRTSLLINGPAADHACGLVRSSGITVGLHWNLTDGFPMLPSRTVSSLVDRQGRFVGVWRLVRRAWAGELNPREIAAELREQLRRFEDRLGRPNHFDSHRHIHTLPMISSGVRQVTGEQPQNGLRLFSRPFGLERTRGLVDAAVIYSQARYSKMTTRTTSFQGFSLMYAADKAAALTAVLCSLPEGLTELMCHPAEKGFDFNWANRYMSDRVAEYQALISPEIQRFVEEKQIQLQNLTC